MIGAGCLPRVLMHCFHDIMSTQHHYQHVIKLTKRVVICMILHSCCTRRHSAIILSYLSEFDFAAEK